MKITRREWLSNVGVASAAAVILPACGGGDDAMVCDDLALELPTGLPEDTYAGPTGPATLFTHGVASGDPLSDAVILWTRVSPDASAPVDVFYEVALDAAFTRRIAAGNFTTSDARDYTVKVDVSGLYPGLSYFYRFKALGVTSQVGRTRTAPVGGSRHLRFAMMSCSSLAHGYFHAYRRVAERADLDAVIHLGDYIYEYATGEYGTVRPYEPAHEIVSLADYRMRYAQNRRDADLAEVHRQHPFIAVWDDHETANDSYVGGAENHQPEEGSFEARKAAAAQAYAEWMPYREQVGGKIYRAFSYGDLLELFMLDTRIEGRDAPLDDIDSETPERRLLGDAQEAWLRERLTSSTARFKLVGQQVMFAQLGLGAAHTPLNLDQWDGYPSARARFLDMIEQDDIANVVILTGDIHSSWVMDVARDPYGAYDPETGEGSLMVEFVTPGVTSPGLPAASAEVIVNAAKMDNPHIKYANFSERGYVVLDITQARVQADYYHLDGIALDSGTETFVGGFVMNDGRPFVVEAKEEAPAREGCTLAPSA